jgi:cell wall-associated NlpC family hydrolase
MRPPSDYIGRRYSGAVPCFDFVAEVMRDQGMALPGYHYAKAEHAEALRRHLSEHAAVVAEPQAGDVVLLNIGGQPAHIGVMVDHKEFVHHDATHGVIRESIRAAHWRNRVAGYWRPRLCEPAAG